VVAGGFLLLVAAVVLFVDEEQAEVLHGCEDAGAGGDDDGGFALTDAAPLFGVFGVREGGVENGDAARRSG
jgi:hypothetical protein